MPRFIQTVVQPLALYTGLGSLFTHELDAVLQSEWRLLYVLRSMPDDEALPLFIWLHVPVFGVIVWLIHHPNDPVQHASRILFASFLLVHAALHIHLSELPLYTFDTTLSQSLIFLAAVCGFAYLATAVFFRREQPRG